MSEENIKVKAARAKALMENDVFSGAIEDLQARQVAVFVNSAADDLAAREEAHAMVRALGKIKQTLQADIDAWNLLEKRKGRHRD